MYYSYSGKTKVLAEAKAKELGADLVEIIEQQRPSILAAFLRGAPKAMSGTAVPIKPLSCNLADYNPIIIMSPVWASNPAPATYSAIQALPPGKKVELFMVSGNSGTKGSADRTKMMITDQGCEVTSYSDVKAVKRDGMLIEELIGKL